MLKNNIDGLIIEPSKVVYHISIQIFIKKIKSAGIPCVFIHADTNPPMNIPMCVWTII